MTPWFYDFMMNKARAEKSRCTADTQTAGCGVASYSVPQRNCQMLSTELEGFKVPFIPSQASEDGMAPIHNEVFLLMPASPMGPAHIHTYFPRGLCRLLKNSWKRVEHE